MSKPAIRAALRVDASLQMGTGHVMRCLTLADSLKQQGGECQFICREHPGNLIEHIRNKGFQVHVLPLLAHAVEQTTINPSQLAHAAWLGATQEQDAAECAAILEQLTPDWLIVDHYALDARWETALMPRYRKLMVIDDLADRPHRCDLLLDQTFGRDAKDYAPWTPETCTLLCGSQYSLLRPEFANLRDFSLKRRETPQLEHLLITMGGVDKDNATGQILKALRSAELPANCNISVVMGSTAPWLDDVRQQANQMPWPTTVKVGISDMAQLMAESDLAIGAAGATSWERCCLGLPTIMVVLAENQKLAAQILEDAQAAVSLRLGQNLTTELAQVISTFTHDSYRLKNISTHARQITDGTGCQFVANTLNTLSL
ncbi:UDP-2,4-diacetamido-2,4,6-trideoxy-beta-L-altropyranose hydrolase [Pseudomonas kulmbachensis]|uniref:UDP-2,4-diacetamido-2,4, 6-trideoxy-beta-L-altropyranose hydrolase n=1 Tax=Pseudomonas kulmbachensis TaxID=3043408 RepID=A0ABW7LT28_9PSED